MFSTDVQPQHRALSRADPQSVGEAGPLRRALCVRQESFGYRSLSPRTSDYICRCTSCVLEYRIHNPNPTSSRFIIRIQRGRVPRGRPGGRSTVERCQPYAFVTGPILSDTTVGAARHQGASRARGRPSVHGHKTRAAFVTVQYNVRQLVGVHDAPTGTT